METAVKHGKFTMRHHDIFVSQLKGLSFHKPKGTEAATVHYLFAWLQSACGKTLARPTETRNRTQQLHLVTCKSCLTSLQVLAKARLDQLSAS